MTANALRALDGTMQPEADNGRDYSMPTPFATTGKEFCLGVVGPATLSVAASKIAVEKAHDPATRDFANFELREAVAVCAILDELNIPVPPMSPEGKSFLETLQETPSGSAFDKIYATAELANHEYLRDLAESYIKNAGGASDPDESSARRLAKLALTAFKEHVVLTKNILKTL